MFKKRDLLILGTVLVLALVSFIIVRSVNSEPATRVEVTVDSDITETYPIGEDGDYEVVGYDGTGKVYFSVSNGTVDVTSADCPNHICVNHRPISRAGESIVCLPNRVIISLR